MKQPYDYDDWQNKKNNNKIIHPWRLICAAEIYIYVNIYKGPSFWIRGETGRHLLGYQWS